MRYHRILHELLAWLVASSIVLAGSVAWSAGPSIGTVSGIRTAEMSLDGGKTWFPLGKQAVPILEGAEIRSAAGAALIDIADGSRLNLLPFSAARVKESGSRIDVSLVAGRLGFRLPAATRVDIGTRVARLEPARQEAVAGEVYVGDAEVTGIHLMQGNGKVHELVGARRALAAGVEPVFVPRRPDGAEQVFASGRGAAPARTAGKAVFNARGESLGFIGEDGRLVVSPGYTSDLTSAFPGKLVRAVLARVPESERDAAVPVFDVNGRWVGYLLGQSFHAVDQTGAASGVAAVSGRPDVSWTAAAKVAPLLAGAGKAITAAATSPARRAPPPPASRFR